jgi:hypothetical protein
MAKTLRITWPILNFRQIYLYKNRQKKEDGKRWSKIRCKGKGVDSFINDKYGNAWLYNPNLLRPSRFLTALKLRSCMTSDRISMNSASGNRKM